MKVIYSILSGLNGDLVSLTRNFQERFLHDQQRAKSKIVHRLFLQKLRLYAIANWNRPLLYSSKSLS